MHAGPESMRYLDIGQMASVELWITQQTEADRRSELSMNVRDDYVIHRYSLNNGEPRLALVYV